MLSRRDRWVFGGFFVLTALWSFPVVWLSPLHAVLEGGWIMNYGPKFDLRLPTFVYPGSFQGLLTAHAATAVPWGILITVQGFLALSRRGGARHRGR